MSEGYQLFQALLTGSQNQVTNTLGVNVPQLFSGSQNLENIIFGEGTFSTQGQGDGGANANAHANTYSGNTYSNVNNHNNNYNSYATNSNINSNENYAQSNTDNLWTTTGATSLTALTPSPATASSDSSGDCDPWWSIPTCAAACPFPSAATTPTTTSSSAQVQAAAQPPTCAVAARRIAFAFDSPGCLAQCSAAVRVCLRRVTVAAYCDTAPAFGSSAGVGGSSTSTSRSRRSSAPLDWDTFVEDFEEEHNKAGGKGLGKGTDEFGLWLGELGFTERP
jgi:hypothetical protein